MDNVTIIYARLTREESIKRGLSLPEQERRAREICKERGWKPVEFYPEPRHVGGDVPFEKRAAGRKIVDRIKSGEVKRILVRHQDRLWRDTDVQSSILNLALDYDIELWQFSGEIRFKSASDKFAVKVQGAAAELEKNMTGERIREMKRGKAHRGHHAGGPPPYGYTSQSRLISEFIKYDGMDEDAALRKACKQIPIPKHLYIDPKEAEVVKLIFELATNMEDPMGWRRITNELNRRGYKRRSGLIWASCKVGNIINNPGLAGMTSYDEKSYSKHSKSSVPRWKQNLYEGIHEPIISLELWKRAQDVKLNTNKRFNRRKSNAKRTYPLTGILFCAKCGKHYNGKGTAASDPKHAIYYMCQSRKYYGPEKCDAPTMNAVHAEKSVWSHLEKLLSNPSVIIQQVDRMNKKLSQIKPKTERAVVERQARLETISAQLNRYYDLFENAVDESDQELALDRMRKLKKEKKIVESELQELGAKVIQMKPKEISFEQGEKYLKRLYKEMQKSTAEQAAFLRLLKASNDLNIIALDKKRIKVSMAVTESAMPVSYEGLHAVGFGPMYSGSPTPGGPQNIREGILPVSKKRERILPSPIMCSWPTKSVIF